MREDEVEGSLKETLRKANLHDLTESYAEVGLDSVFDDGLLRDVPVLATILAIARAGAGIRDHLLARKLLTFLRPIGEVDVEVREQMIARLDNDAGYSGRIGEELLLLLDRLDTIGKAELMGRAFAAYLNRRIDGVMLRRLNYAIDRVQVIDLPKLSDFARRISVGAATAQGFVNAGLGYIPAGFASTEVRPLGDVCKAFIDCVLEL